MSVMMDEVLEAFRDVRARTHVDGTLGAGGHARAMIEAHEEMEHFVGFDVDASARSRKKASARDAAGEGGDARRRGDDDAAVESGGGEF